jgi:hypothetical protein
MREKHPSFFSLSCGRTAPSNRKTSTMFLSKRHCLLVIFLAQTKKTMFFLNRRMSSAKASPFSSGFILFSEHEILMLLANKTQKVRGKKNVLCAGTSP